MEKTDKLKEINTTIQEQINNYFSDIYNPGQIKEQLELGKEVKGSNGSNGKYFCGNSSRITTDGIGIQSITGIGFKPKMVVINAVYAGTGGQISFGEGTNESDNFCVYTNPVDGASYNNARIIDVGDSRAKLISLDNSGFSLEWTTIGVNVNFSYKCYG